MSVETAPDPSAQLADAADARKRGRGMQPGLSLLARGEPMIWLTGGALAICVAMIVGLLAMVVVLGLQTFWPVPIVQVKLVDGRVLMGQITREEDYSLSNEMTSTLSGATKDAALELLNGQDSTRVHRRLLRTGNFRLTNEHFNWVSDYEIEASGEDEPEWALLVERVAWGRFLGVPQEFQLSTRRKRSEEEARLLAEIQFFDANRWRLSPEDGELLQQELEPVRAAHAQIRTEQIDQFREAFQDQSTVRYLVGSQQVPQDELTPDQDVEAAIAVTEGSAAAWVEFLKHHGVVRERFAERHHLEKHAIGRANGVIERARLNLREAELNDQVFALELAQRLKETQFNIDAIQKALTESAELVERIASERGTDSGLTTIARKMLAGVDTDIQQQLEEPLALKAELEKSLEALPEEVQQVVAEFQQTTLSAEAEIAEIQKEIDQLNDENDRFVLAMKTADGIDQNLELGDVVRAFPANQLELGDKLSIYGSRWMEFLWDAPREANSEGGVFPAIWGTVAMTLIMSLVVVPFGVLAALYLREYAKAGFMISSVRIAINNLAGVPSIVFGVFGLSFFCYRLGAFMDGGPENAGIAPWPAPIWFLVLGVLALVAVLAFFCSLMTLGARKDTMTFGKRLVGNGAVVLWIAATLLFVAIIAKNPHFGGFYAARLPNPYLGKGGLLWASLTLALLTLPVVIVATEEALSAVPNSLREGSFACGAGKWQTIRRIVLPHAMPGIMTGMILAMARGAGEVAPLMLVGAVKLAPELPLDFANLSGSFGVLPTGPLHLDRSFMHLGFHIYDLGFQSQNSEAAKPMVFTTTLLLIGLIAFLNVAAVGLRARLRKRFHTGQF